MWPKEQHDSVLPSSKKPTEAEKSTCFGRDIMRTVFLSIAALALLQSFLVLNIAFMRMRYKVFFGAPEDPENPLFRARLAHSNAAEFGPILCVLMLSMELYGHQFALMPAVYGSIVLCRVCAAIGLLNFSPAKPNALRAIGLCGTLAAIVGLALVLIFQASPALVK